MRLPIITSVLLIFLLLGAENTKANNAAAGEIIYQHLGDSTYRVIFKLYTSCNGSAFPASIALCINDTCTNTGFSSIVPRYTGLIRNNTSLNGSETPIACTPKERTACTDAYSTLPGYREWWYVDTITLPSRCTGWRLSVSVSSRNISSNVHNGNFYVETWFNNQLSLNNSSPDFTNQPLMFVCRNQPFTYNIGATDADGDSLDIEVVPMKTTTAHSCPATIYEASLFPATPPYNLSTNPFQTNNTFTLNSKTGVLNFTATANYISTFTVRINEYRNGQLIGSVSRDMQVYIFDCSRIVPTGGMYANYEIRRYNVPSGETYGTVWAKTGQPIHLVYTATSDDKDAQIILADNHDTTFSNSIFYYIGNRSNNVEGHFFWTPGKDDTGHYNLVTLVTDSACRPPGIFPVFMHTTDIVVALGLDEVVGDKTVNVYPNPNNGVFTIQIPGYRPDTPMQLNIVNIYGQVVYSANDFRGGEVDMSGAIQGMYVLMLNDGARQYKKSFVVQ